MITVDLGCVSCSYLSRDPISGVYMFHTRVPAGFPVLILVPVPSFAAYSMAFILLTAPLFQNRD